MAVGGNWTALYTTHNQRCCINVNELLVIIIIIRVTTYKNMRGKGKKNNKPLNAILSFQTVRNTEVKNSTFQSYCFVLGRGGGRDAS